MRGVRWAVFEWGGVHWTRGPLDKEGDVPLKSVRPRKNMTSNNVVQPPAKRYTPHTAEPPPAMTTFSP